MNNFEGSTSSSTGMTSNSPSDFPFELATPYIDHVLSPFTNEGSPSQILILRMKLSDIMAPIASDFSQLCDNILQGAMMFSSKESSKPLSGQVNRVALELLKGLGSTHWTAVALLAIAKVLERLDKISTNDRDCIDLLKSLLDLATFMKMVKDINTDFCSDILAKMKEALHLILSGSILCHSFITSSKWSKFVLTKSIGQELVYLRGKVESMKLDILLRLNFILLKSLISQPSSQQNLTAQRKDSNDPGEMANIFTTTLHIRAADTTSPEFFNFHNFTREKRCQGRKRLAQKFATFARFLKYAAKGFIKLVVRIFNVCQMPVDTHLFRKNESGLGMRLNEDQIPLLKPWMTFENNYKVHSKATLRNHG